MGLGRGSTRSSHCRSGGCYPPGIHNAPTCTAAAKDFEKPLVTEIGPLKKFHEAELYHQDYFALNPNQPYCASIIVPKLQNLLLKKVLPPPK